MAGTPLSRLQRGKCVYTKEGICRDHGEGARKHCKPVMETYIGPNGEKKRRVKERRVYFVSDTDLSGNKKLRRYLSTRRRIVEKEEGTLL